MKYLYDLSLKKLLACLTALLLVVLIAEFFIIRQKLTSLNEVQNKVDFARRAQVSGQNIMLDYQLYLNGTPELYGKIYSLIDEQDNLLKTIHDGGRIEKTNSFLSPLNHLQQITAQKLQAHWGTYKAIIQESLQQHNLNKENRLPEPQHIDSLSVDSLHYNTVIDVNNDAGNVNLKAKALAAGKWLTLSSWYDKLILDFLEEKHEKDTAFTWWILGIVITDIVFLIGVFWFLNKIIVRPIQLLESNTLNQMQTKGMPSNEIGKLAVQINDTIEHLRDATEFVQKIGEGNLSINYKDLDGHYVEGKNKLADSLIVMQSKLKALNDEEQKRQWVNEGLAKFVDILRSSHDNIHILGDNIISALVKYTGSNQGGLYTLNEDDIADKHLELISLFAFNIKKFQTKKIKLGEGLLGQTFLEKETTYLNEVPEEYIRITSGLGDANPKSVLMVPLRVDKEILGIVELASFKEYQKHEILFVEKLGETIASTLASVKSAQRNRQLIEQFQQQTEEMRAQEEEMRQNMEELQATQEEIARKEQRYLTRISELENNTNAQTAPDAALQEELVKKEQDYKALQLKLEQALKQRSKSDDWALAEQVANELKINLEAIKIAREELTSNIEKK